MPIINLKISKRFDSETLQSVIQEITDLTEKHLKKKPEVTAITVQFIEREHWFVHATSLHKLNQNSFYLDIKVTDGTNFKDEKSAFVNAIFAYMNTMLENLHSESYVYVEEVKADAYGFGGITQEFRFIETKLRNNS